MSSSAAPDMVERWRDGGACLGSGSVTIQSCEVRLRRERERESESESKDRRRVTEQLANSLRGMRCHLRRRHASRACQALGNSRDDNLRINQSSTFWTSSQRPTTSTSIHQRFRSTPATTTATTTPSLHHGDVRSPPHQWACAPDLNPHFRHPRARSHTVSRPHRAPENLYLSLPLPASTAAPLPSQKH